MSSALKSGTTPNRAPIPCQVLFGDPDRTNPKLSPEGHLLAYAGPHEGVMNLWVQPVDGSTPPRPVTADQGRGITDFEFCAGERIVYLQDTDGDEISRLYVLDLSTGHQARLVTPERGVQARIIGSVPSRHPDRMAITLFDGRFLDVYELDLPTGELTKIAADPAHDGRPQFNFWLVDKDLRARGGVVSSPDGGVVLHVRDGAEGPYRQLIEIPGADFELTISSEFTADGGALNMTTWLKSPTKRLIKVDMAGNITPISSDSHADVEEVWCDPATLEPALVTYASDQGRHDVLDPGFRADFERLATLGDNVKVESADCRGRFLLVSTNAPDAGIHYHLYDRKTGEARYLFAQQDGLADHQLAPKTPFWFTARDGLELHGYLTRPVGAPAGPGPTLFMPHGGPWLCDKPKYQAEVQYFASLGFTVVQINFRASSGYGKAHMNAGNREWGRAMQHDLLDGLAYLVAEGVIDPDRVGIYGFSYGGYAALVAAAFNGDVFRCAIDVCGPADPATLITSASPRAQPMIAFYHTRIGHPERDAARLREVSPLAHADQIRIPVLIVEGTRDYRVRNPQTGALIDAMKKNGVPHRHLPFDDEGHYITRPDNRQTLAATAAEFLTTHLLQEPASAA